MISSRYRFYYVFSRTLRQNWCTQSFALDCKALYSSIVVKAVHSTFSSIQSAHHCIISLRLSWQMPHYHIVMVHYCFVEWIENWGEKDIPKPQNLIFRICRKGGVNRYLRMKTELVQMWYLWWSHTSSTMLVMVSLMTTRWSENSVAYQIAYQTKITNHETLVHGGSQGYCA